MTISNGRALFGWQSREVSTAADGSAENARITGFYLLFDAQGNVSGAELPRHISQPDEMLPVSIKGTYSLDEDEILIEWERQQAPPLRPEDKEGIQRTRHYFSSGKVYAFFEGSAMHYQNLNFQLIAGNPDFLFDD